LILTKHQCDRNRIKVKTKFDVKLPKVKIDKNRIEQVIVDLMINSILSMKDGGNLTISTYAQKIAAKDKMLIKHQPGLIELGDEVVSIDIDDTGDGIKEEDLSRIFDPFFTTRRAAGGVGLGLSIARTIMNNHGGIICVDNRKSGGTRAKLIFKT